MRSESRWPQIGILLLIYELFASIGLDKIPPVTLGAIGLQIGLFLKVLSPYLGAWTLWSSSTVCLNANVIMKQKELYRIFTAPVFHGSDLHLYYNMVCHLPHSLIVDFTHKYLHKIWCENPSLHCSLE